MPLVLHEHVNMRGYDIPSPDEVAQGKTSSRSGKLGASCDVRPPSPASNRVANMPLVWRITGRLLKAGVNRTRRRALCSRGLIMGYSVMVFRA